MARLHNQKNTHSSNPLIWVFTTYFAEGFPFTIIRTVSSAFFRHQGLSLKAIGLTSLYGLPWTLKFLWGPQVDEFATKRKWLLFTQGTLVILIVLTALLSPLSWALQAIAALFFLGSAVAATHDIAIDGFYMEALDEKEQSKFVGYRVMAYRIAMMIGTAGLTYLGPRQGWAISFGTAALLMTGLFVFHYYFLPRCETEKKSISPMLHSLLKGKTLLTVTISALAVIIFRLFLDSAMYNTLQSTYPLLKHFDFSAWIGLFLLLFLICIALFREKIYTLLTRDPTSFYAKSFLSFMDREAIGAILAFIIFIRTGEFMLSTMAAPFMVDLGILEQYWWISGFVGMPCSIAGAMLGGWLISRKGLKKTILPFLLAQNLSNIIYMFLALALGHYLAVNTGNPLPESIGLMNLSAVVLVHGFDQFAGGLGTAVLWTYLLRICKPDYKAAHYAIGTGLMNVSGLYAGSLGGFLASWFGYGYFFGISFLMSIPGMILVFFIPMLENK